MSDPAEEIAAQFRAWEERGRGRQVYEERVALEPPFRPFLGYTLKPVADDGRSRSHAAKAVRIALVELDCPGKLFHRLAGRKIDLEQRAAHLANEVPGIRQADKDETVGDGRYGEDRAADVERVQDAELAAGQCRGLIALPEPTKPV